VTVIHLARRKVSHDAPYASFLNALTTAGLFSTACPADGHVSQQMMEGIGASNFGVENAAAIIQHGMTRGIEAKEATHRIWS
jgi:hypothetical protein